MIRLFNRYWSATAGLAVAVETGLLLAAFAAAHRMRAWVSFHDVHASLYSPPEYWVRSGLFVAVIFLFLYFEGLYDFDGPISLRQLGIKIVRGLCFAALTLWAIYFTFPGVAIGRGIFALALGLACGALAIWRPLLVWLIARRLFSERILIIGSDESAKALAIECLDRRHLGYRVVGFLSDDPRLQGVSLVNPRVIGTTAQACELALANDVTRVVVAQQDSRGKVSLDSLLSCKTHGIPVARASTYYEQLTGKVMLDGRRIKSWLVFSSGFVVSAGVNATKRLFDFVASFVGLVLAAPLIAVIAVAVRLDSPGSPFFRQERVGLRGKTFTLWKIRTMRKDAESIKAVWAEANDARITRLGKLLRTTRLDELPQLWNVLTGTMSLVGPRPERKPFVDELIERCPLYEERLAVRPGLTGWAQIRAPYAASFDESIEKLRYDLYYIKNLSFFLDLSILASTLRIVLFGRGAR